MLVLGIHSKGLTVGATEKALAGATSLSEEERTVEISEDCLVAYVGVEREDEANLASVSRQLAESLRHRAGLLGLGHVVLYPYVHLTDDPASGTAAQRALAGAHELLSPDLEVTEIPFGWYKSFSLACTGHPLSEYSARFSPEEEEPTPRPPALREGSEFVRWICVDRDGMEYEVTPETYRDAGIFRSKDAAYELLERFVANEIGSSPDTVEARAPDHIRYMRDHELIDYCDISEKGHLKWYPRGVLIKQLLTDRAREIARVWGAFEMANPLVIKGDSNLVGQLMGEFHERDYRVDGGRGTCYLRYASDPGAFPFMQKVRFTHRQAPLRVYEEASCFRNEQEGEVSGLRRVRAFSMTDMHSACASEGQAREEFRHLSLLFADLVTTLIARDRWVLGWEGTVEFYESYRDYLIEIGRALGVPAFFKLMPRMSHYYAMKNEFQSITADGASVQVSTVQWDVKDGPRFDIGYVSDTGEKVPCPVIIHASSFGSIERSLCALLENVAVDSRKGIPPMLPYWLSPTQVRVVPVSEPYLDHALLLAERISGLPARCDVDDRDETVGRRIRQAEADWVPYTIVVGEREVAGDSLPVRIRETRSQQSVSLSDLQSELGEKQRDLPFRPLPTRQRVSENPGFYG